MGRPTGWPELAALQVEARLGRHAGLQRLAAALHRLVVGALGSHVAEVGVVAVVEDRRDEQVGLVEERPLHQVVLDPGAARVDRFPLHVEPVLARLADVDPRARVRQLVQPDDSAVVLPDVEAGAPAERADLVRPRLAEGEVHHLARVGIVVLRHRAIPVGQVDRGVRGVAALVLGMRDRQVDEIERAHPGHPLVGKLVARPALVGQVGGVVACDDLLAFPGQRVGARGQSGRAALQVFAHRAVLLHAPQAVLALADHREHLLGDEHEAVGRVRAHVAHVDRQVRHLRMGLGGAADAQQFLPRVVAPDLLVARVEERVAVRQVGQVRRLRDDARKHQRRAQRAPKRDLSHLVSPPGIAGPGLSGSGAARRGFQKSLR